MLCFRQYRAVYRAYLPSRAVAHPRMLFSCLLLGLTLLCEAKQDYYKTLKVPRTATKREIKDAWNKYSKKYHPDHHRGLPNQEKVQERFIKYAEAWNTLRNDKKRLHYDKTGDFTETFDINDIFKDNQKEEDTSTIIGIDLGTTFSVVGVWVGNGKVEIIPNEYGNRLTPSVVAFTESGERLIGEAALNQLTTNPENTIFNVKRLIGRKFNDPEVQNDIKNFPFKVFNYETRPYVQVKPTKWFGFSNDIKEFSPEEISAMVLTKMKETAESYLGRKVSRAVITVPAYFNDAQRTATKDAGTIAGLKVERIISEPTAAAIAYGMHKKEEDKNVLVYDLGGGTFDVSVLNIDRGRFEVMATAGDTHLGGEDFNQKVIDHFVESFKTKSGEDIRNDARSVQKIRREVERAKKELSTHQRVKVDVESLFKGVDFAETLTRAQFENMNVLMFKETLQLLEEALLDADLTKRDIDEIVLVGGSTRIPKVQALVKEFFGGKVISVSRVSRDEAIAYGAAVQGGILAGKLKSDDLVIIDVTPLSLGTGVVGELMSTVVPKNTIIPTKKMKTFVTVKDNQQTINCPVYEGERPMTKDNHKLGEFMLHNIPPLPRHEAKVDVTFQIDADGLLTVTAVDQSDEGNRNSISIKNSERSLDSDDIDRMIKEAKDAAEEDAKLKRRADARNDLEQYIYTVKKRLKEGMSEKLSTADREKINMQIIEKSAWLRENQDSETYQFLGKEMEMEEVVKAILKKSGIKDEL